jgi:hypothetical protein
VEDDATPRGLVAARPRGVFLGVAGSFGTRAERGPSE